MKTCNKCGLTKPDIAFNRSRSDCRRCQKKAWQEWRGVPENLAKIMANSARHRAEQAGVEYAIEASDIKIPERCPVLDIPLEAGGELTPNSPTLDRINPDLGYVPGNIVVISHLANRIKSDATPQQIMRVAEWIAGLRD